MTVLILGLLLWIATHLLKRVAPNARAALTDKMGDRARGVIAGLILLSIILMVIGFRSADGAVFWGRSPMLTGINNLLVLLGFYFFAAAGAKTRVVQYTRHPQLVGFSLWAFAHLLVNGDMASIILFGGLLLWALLEMAIISRAEGPYEPPHAPPIKKEITAAVAAVVLFVVVGGVHALLGYNPFGG